MTITISSSSPTNSSTLIPIDTTISCTLSTTAPPINPSSIVVKVNQQLTTSSGVTVPGAKLTSIITTSGTDVVINLTFTSIGDTFDPFQLVNVEMQAADSSGNYINYLTFRTIDTIPPSIVSTSPIGDSKDPSTTLFIRLQDQQSGIRQNSINVDLTITDQSGTYNQYAILNGLFQPGYSGEIITNGFYTDVIILKSNRFPSYGDISVGIYCEDEVNYTVGSYNFKIKDIAPPIISGFVPLENSNNIPEDTTISFLITDQNQSGLAPETINVLINNNPAIINGILQYSFVDPSSQLIISSSGAIVSLKPNNNLPSASLVTINCSASDNFQNRTEKVYEFQVRDYIPPEINLIAPKDLDINVIPSTTIQFEIEEDLDGSGIDFQALSIIVDGYDVLNHTRNGAVVDGYYSDYLQLKFQDPSINSIYQTPAIQTYPGFQTTITRISSNRCEISVVQNKSFAFDQTVPVFIEVADRGGFIDSKSYSFTTTDKLSIITTADPSTDKFNQFIDGYGILHAADFLNKTGVTLTCNIPNGIIYYTTDGTTPSADKYGIVKGTTKVYTNNILINRQGTNVVKYFAIDPGGNKEEVRQDIYVIDPTPPLQQTVTAAKIVADIPFPTKIVSVETTSIFYSGQRVTILDDIQPPITAMILVVNKTSDPQYIIIDREVSRLKINKNARVIVASQPIDPQKPIQLDNKNFPQYLYIGSDYNQSNQADCVFDQLRILNKASTDQQILADYTLLAKRYPFINSDNISIADLPSDLTDLEKQRINIPDNTLVLLDFDGKIQNNPRQGALSVNDNQITDVNAASNDVIITIVIKKDESVDRELLRTILQNFAPVDLNVIVEFQEIG